MDYTTMNLQLEGMAQEEAGFIPLLSNASALIYQSMDRLNWAGFYLMDKGSLLLGPFQGKVACIRIKVGKGVCGAAVEKDQVQRVPDVHLFPGHIACDSASESEIVIPIHKDGAVIGVLDIDSPVKERFDEADEKGLTEFVHTLEKYLTTECVTFR